MIQWLLVVVHLTSRILLFLEVKAGKTLVYPRGNGKYGTELKSAR
jgi:hypothetical protein